MSDDVDQRQLIVDSRLDALTETAEEFDDLLGVNGDKPKRVREARKNGGVMDRLEQLEQQFSRIEAQLNAIQDLGREKSTKEEKVASLVRYAQNLSNDGTTGVQLLEARDIQGVAGVTRRYAYDLMDELPDQYDFFLDRDDLKQYGDVEIDKSSKSRALAVDLDILHSDEEAVNKFTTRTTSEGASA